MKMPGLVVDDEVTSVEGVDKVVGVSEGVDSVVGVADVEGEAGTDLELEFDVVIAFADKNGDVLVFVSSFSSSILFSSPKNNLQGITSRCKKIP